MVPLRILYLYHDVVARASSPQLGPQNLSDRVLILILMLSANRSTAIPPPASCSLGSHVIWAEEVGEAR